MKQCSGGVGDKLDIFEGRFWYIAFVNLYDIMLDSFKGEGICECFGRAAVEETDFPSRPIDDSGDRDVEPDRGAVRTYRHGKV